MWGFCPYKSLWKAASSSYMLTPSLYVHSHWHQPVLLTLSFPAALCPVGMRAPPPLQTAAMDLVNPLPSWLSWAGLFQPQHLLNTFMVFRDANRGAWRELLFLQVNPAHALPVSNDGSMGRVICLFQSFCGFTMYLHANDSTSVIYLCKVLWDQKIKALGYLFISYCSINFLSAAVHLIVLKVSCGLLEKQIWDRK